MSIKKHVSSPGLDTDIGHFKLLEGDILGEGGNSFVYPFYLEGENGEQKHFAIKFLKKGSGKNKVKRFIDEFFCVIQMDSHPNIVKPYHFDKVVVNNEEYNIIVMKKYTESLAEKYQKLKDTDKYEAHLLKLQNDMFEALDFLHSNNVIHRDIKPENIFYDEITDKYVLGDLGIAFFDPEYFSRMANTPASERIANYLFSAPEQREKGRGEVTFSADIYALGQVLYWFEHGKTYQGTGGVANKVLYKCLLEDPDLRFQRISDIQSFIEAEQQPKVDYWGAIDHLDNAIRQTFPKIKGLEISEDQNKINGFLTLLSKYKRLEDYWWMNEKGGDLQLRGVEPLGDNSWLFDKYHEIEVEKIIVYRDMYHSTYKNFFILIIKPSIPFPIVDEQNILINKDVTGWSEDSACLWNGRYIPTSDTVNGYYEFEGESIPVRDNEFLTRYRYLKEAAYIVAPIGTGLNSVSRSVPSAFLQKILKDSDCDLLQAEEYANTVAKHLAYEIWSSL